MQSYMKKAIEEANKAFKLGETPVGAVLVENGEVIASAHNTTQADANPLMHAEIKLIHNALSLMGRRRLEGCEIYVTMEPCPMCAGAIILSGIKKVVFGAYDMSFGAFGSAFNLLNASAARKMEVYGGICELECAQLLTDFYKGVRNKNEN